MSNNIGIDISKTEVTLLKRHNAPPTVQARKQPSSEAAGLLSLALPGVRNVVLRATVDAGERVVVWLQVYVPNVTKPHGVSCIARQMVIGPGRNATGVTAALLKRAKRCKVNGDAVVVDVLTLVNVDDDLNTCIDMAMAEHMQIKTLEIPKEVLDNTRLAVNAMYATVEKISTQVEHADSLADKLPTTIVDDIPTLLNDMRACSAMLHTLVGKCAKQVTAMDDAVAAITQPVVCQK